MRLLDELEKKLSSMDVLHLSPEEERAQPFTDTQLANVSIVCGFYVGMRLF